MFLQRKSVPRLLATHPCIAGRNNSGKSNLLLALLAFSKWKGKNPRNALGDAGVARPSFGDRAEPIRISLRLAEDVWRKAVESPPEARQVSLTIEANTTGDREVEGIVSIECENETTEELRFGGALAGGRVSEGGVSVVVGELGQRLGDTFALRAERQLHIPDDNAKGQQYLDMYGANVLQVLNSLSSSSPDVLATIAQRARPLLPGVEAILAPLNENAATVRGEAREKAFESIAFTWDQIASGTRHVVALLTLLYSTPRGALLLIEEPESFLHPQAAVDLFGLIEEVAKEHDKQIIMTSHSPVLMELAGPRLNVVVRDEETGVSMIVRPTPGAEKALAQRGLMKSFMLTPYQSGFIPAGLLIVEGDDDVAVWDKWLASSGLSEQGVVALDAKGGGEAVKLALYLRHLQNAGIRSAPFYLVLDSDGNHEKKQQDVVDQRLPASDFHVLQKNEIEDYLMRAEAIAAEFGVDENRVEELISKARAGKQGLNSVVAGIGRLKGLRSLDSVNATLKGQIAGRIDPYDDLVDVIEFFQRKLAKALHPQLVALPTPWDA